MGTGERALNNHPESAPFDLTPHPSSSPSNFKLQTSASAAPTPDNNQPWRFDIHRDAFVIRLDRSRLLPSDVDGMFDLIGLGAALTNVYLATAAAGQPTRILIENADGHLVPPPSEISDYAGWEDEGELAAEIFKRHTNRRPYSTRPLTAAEREQLVSAALPAVPGLERFRITWLTRRPEISRFAALVARCDRLRFEYPAFHAELFKQLRFGPEEAERTGDGLDVRTLELPPGGATFLSMLRSWKAMQMFRAVGGTRLLAFPSRISVIRSGAVGLVSFGPSGGGDALSSEAPLESWRRDSLLTGAVFQRLWLKASRLGLALQPLGSLPLFFARINRLGGAGLTIQDQQAVRRLESRFQNLVPHLKGHTLGMAFRIGHARPPKYRSPRRSGFPA